MSGLEKKFATKSKIVNYIINRESTSKVEISKELNLSMPTVLSNVKDLLEKGIIIEIGEYESTGGRKAKSIGINPSYRYAMGIVITANHLGMVLVNLKYEIVKSERIRLKFVSDMSYCSQVADYAAKFLDHMDDAEQKEKLLGVGISIPGIINQEQKLVIKSHALKLENYSLRPSLTYCTNAWIKGNGLDDIRESILLRGNDSRFFYNCFCRINGAEDKLTYANELFRLQQELRNSKRNTVIVSKEIPRPTPQEISEIKRSNYTSGDQMLLGLACNIQYGANPELQRILHKTFVDVMLAESQKEGENLNRLTNRAVYLLCWLRRYLPKLFINWKSPEIGCFIYLGGCRNENEALFMSFLGRLPLDVLILCPDLNIKCCLEDKLLYEVNYPESLAITEYPEESSQVKIGTAAYHAERELDTLMYQDSGIYRNQQYVKANVINLQTMYEEIKLLWDQELKYRPNFSTVNGVVNIPVIFSKISGVKDGSVSQYWESIAALITEDTVVVKSAPYIEPTASGPMKAFAVEFYKNGKLLRNKIKNHPRYPYHLLREEMQEFILDKLQLLIERKLIKGIGENGTEYTVIAQILDLPKEILRLIQKFDFTKKNPKLIYINTGETMISLQDSILVTFLNLAGFDILFFVPTGYQSVENYFAEKLMEEHQIGEYKYDMQVPDLNNISTNSTRPSWRRKLFRRG